MKNNHRIGALLLALLMLATPLATACTGNEPEGATDTETQTETSGETETTPGGSNTETETGGNVNDGKVEYTFTVSNIGGRALEGLTFHVYSGEEMVGYGTTGTDGVGSVRLDPSKNDYRIQLLAHELPAGYEIADSYPLTSNGTAITLTTRVIEGSDLSGVSYKLGDVIHDFTVTTTDGETFTLAKALEGKKGVLINFFYTTCGPCVNEFPFMEEAYQQFKNDIEIIALNNFGGDSEKAVADFKASMGLSFPMAKDDSPLYTAFTPLVESIYGQTGYPTSIFIDRYGVICLVELGGLPSVKPFVAAFDHFVSDNYRQTLIQSIDSLTPTEKPNLNMPTTEEIGATVNSDGFTAIYYPETEADDAEYSWPFVIGEKDGRTVIYAANRFKDASFATMHMDVELKAGEALAVDYFASCENRADILYVLVDNKDIYQISGESEAWKTCYPYVATEDGTYKVTFIYLKDSGTDTGEDTVYLDNFRIVSETLVDTPTYIYRFAATNPNANGLGYKNYATVVYNETDGYYHVGTTNGPILLVNLMGGTRFSDTSINDLGYNGQLVEGDVNYYETIVNYANYAINGSLYGFSPVTEELKTILERISDLVGWEKGNPNQWLQMCSYYDHYGTDEPLEDPVKGVAFFAAFETVESTDTEEKFNTVTYDGRVIMPRGLKYKFVPSKSGAYIIQSQSKDEVNGWLFNDKYELIYTADIVERFVTDNTNVTMIHYMEAGETYYIDIAYYDIYAAGTFTFTVKFLGETYDQLHIASPGPFTFIETSGGGIGETIAGGIEVTLADDGYFHELLADGSIGSIVYADFSYSTGLFSHSILRMIELKGFDFSKSPEDEEVLTYYKENNDAEQVHKHFMAQWGENYDQVLIDEILAGSYHGKGQNYTDAISAYISKMITAEENAELAGCVAVDAELAEILQAIMDKYTFAGVENSWTKLCYYYKHHGPING